MLLQIIELLAQPLRGLLSSSVFGLEVVLDIRARDGIGSLCRQPWVLAAEMHFDDLRLRNQLDVESLVKSLHKTKAGLEVKVFKANASSHSVVPGEVFFMLQAQLLNNTGGNRVALNNVDLGLKFRIQIEAHWHYHLLQAEVVVPVKVQENPCRRFVMFWQQQRRHHYQQQHNAQRA